MTGDGINLLFKIIGCKLIDPNYKDIEEVVEEKDKSEKIIVIENDDSDNNKEDGNKVDNNINNNINNQPSSNSQKIKLNNNISNNNIKNKKCC